tara:strand:+ start:230 stop:580 length:351 start_codon:yes stop_codon:yes gene_type:complete
VKIYALEVIIGPVGNMSIETIGMYTTKLRAIQAMEKLPAPTDELVYNIEQFKVDDEPRDIFQDSHQDVKRLMDEGIIDQLVGEDGRFYYVLTQLGNEIAKKIDIEINKNDDKNQSL